MIALLGGIIVSVAVILAGTLDQTDDPLSDQYLRNFYYVLYAIAALFIVRGIRRVQAKLPADAQQRDPAFCAPSADNAPLVGQHPRALGPEGMKREGEHHVVGHIVAGAVANPHRAHILAFPDRPAVQCRGLTRGP